MFELQKLTYSGEWERVPTPPFSSEESAREAAHALLVSGTTFRITPIE